MLLIGRWSRHQRLRTDGQHNVVVAEAGWLLDILRQRPRADGGSLGVPVCFGKPGPSPTPTTRKGICNGQARRDRFYQLAVQYS
jgi:hypothetical protein